MPRIVTPHRKKRKAGTAKHTKSSPAEGDAKAHTKKKVVRGGKAKLLSQRVARRQEKKGDNRKTGASRCSTHKERAGEKKSRTAKKKLRGTRAVCAESERKKNPGSGFKFSCADGCRNEGLRSRSNKKKEKKRRSSKQKTGSKKNKKKIHIAGHVNDGTGECEQ